MLSVVHARICLVVELFAKILQKTGNRILNSEHVLEGVLVDLRLFECLATLVNVFLSSLLYK